MTSEAGHKNLNEIVQDYRTKKEGVPFFEPENNPHYDLFAALKTVVPDMKQLVARSLTIVAAFRDLDALPRHDTVMTDDEVSNLGVRINYRRADTLYSMRQRVGHVHKQLVEANTLLHDQLRGEDKALEGRLAHQTNEIGQLLQSIEAALSKTRSVNRPFEIRQELMATLILDLSDQLDLVVPLRKACRDHGLPEADLKELLALETSLYLHRSAFQKWRDNPSQRLAGKLKSSADDLAVQYERARSLLRTGLTVCRSQGFRRFHRTGEIFHDHELD